MYKTWYIYRQMYKRWYRQIYERRNTQTCIREGSKLVQLYKKWYKQTDTREVVYTDTRDGVYRQLKASVLYTRTTFSLTKLGSTRAVFSLRKRALQV